MIVLAEAGAVKDHSRYVLALNHSALIARRDGGSILLAAHGNGGRGCRFAYPIN